MLTKIREEFWNENIGYMESETQLVEKYAKQAFVLTVLLSGNTLMCGSLKYSKAMIFMYLTPNQENPGERILPIDTWIPFGIGQYL